MSSFERIFLPGPEDADRVAPGGWAPLPWRPREDELGVAVPLGLVLARSGQGVVALAYAVAHSEALRLSLLAQARGLTRRAVQMLFHEQHQVDPDDLPDGFLRLGIELPGGVSVSNLGQHRDGPMLLEDSGTSGGGSDDTVTMRNDYWLWPLPEPGPIAVSCEWPLVGIPLTRVELDATPLVEAAARAVPLWP